MGHCFHLNFAVQQILNNLSDMMVILDSKNGDLTFMNLTMHKFMTDLGFTTLNAFFDQIEEISETLDKVLIIIIHFSIKNY